MEATCTNSLHRGLLYWNLVSAIPEEENFELESHSENWGLHGMESAHSEGRRGLPAVDFLLERTDDVRVKRTVVKSDRASDGSSKRVSWRKGKVEEQSVRVAMERSNSYGNAFSPSRMEGWGCCFRRLQTSKIARGRPQR